MQQQQHLEQRTQQQQQRSSWAASAGANNSSRKLSDAEWESVWRQVGEFSDAERDRLLSSKWKDLKRQNDQATLSRFGKVADLHNQLLRARLEQSDQNTDHATTLPTFFRVSDDDDGDDDKDGGPSSCSSSESFYVWAPLAQGPDDFAMRIHPDQASDLNSLNNNNPLLKIGRDESLDFKPSLTKCTILQRTYLSPSSPSLPAHHPQDDTSNNSSQQQQQQRVPVTLVALEPRTGRRHQLRVHMALAGHPVLGDQTYAPGGRSLSNRLCLHSSRLTIPGLLQSQPDNNNDPEAATLHVEAESPFRYVRDGDFVDIRMF